MTAQPLTAADVSRACAALLTITPQPVHVFVSRSQLVTLYMVRSDGGLAVLQQVGNTFTADELKAQRDYVQARQVHDLLCRKARQRIRRRGPKGRSIKRMRRLARQVACEELVRTSIKWRRVVERKRLQGEIYL